ncbi:hypothetical protein BKH43_05240 [Helicobacter sp. 13S00401-1]|uniref:autotransporter outer membrane beta-barrel domain-containing protein n=1 Tax=Helicobacter sp. 13S00401-1 TaxID=1905758 RepID=UPI000BA6B16E|nr:autotransporter outer membrane beta-barrel domain-containing protein [Helicobacter sp. 13S00401-1]PAF50307.1 hypothetical protein BKH43_05240 [Helicobacter sp. 13S00401-1]
MFKTNCTLLSLLLPSFLLADHEFKAGESNFPVTTSSLGKVTTETNNTGVLLLQNSTISFTNIGIQDKAIKSIVFDHRDITTLSGRNGKIYTYGITGNDKNNNLTADSINALGILKFTGQIQAYSIDIKEANLTSTSIKPPQASNRRENSVSIATLNMNGGIIETDSFTSSDTINLTNKANLSLKGRTLPATSEFANDAFTSAPKVTIKNASLDNSSISVDGSLSANEGDQIFLTLKNGSSVSAYSVAGANKLVTKGGSSTTKNTLTINDVNIEDNNNLVQTSFHGLDLSPFTTINTQGDFSSTSTNTFYFTTTESSFDIASITSENGSIELQKSLNINSISKDSKSHFENFLKNKAGIKNAGDEATKALLLKSSFLSSATGVTLGASKIDGGYFSSTTYSVKDINGIEKGNYKLGSKKLDSGFIFVDFHLGKKESQSDDNVLDLLAKYNSQGLYNLIESNPKPEGANPVPAPKEPESPVESSKDDNPNPSGLSESSTDKNTPSDAPLSKPSLDSILQSHKTKDNIKKLALKIDEFANKDSINPNSPSGRVYERFSFISGDEDIRRAKARAMLQELLPNDMDNSLQNYALESNSATTDALDSIVASSMLANSLKDIDFKKLRFASTAPLVLPYIKEKVSEVYAQVLYQNIIQGSRDSIKGYSSNTFAFLTGSNQRVLNMIVGFNVGYANSRTSFDSIFNSLSSRVYLYSLESGFTYHVSLGYSLHSISSTRTQSTLETSSRASYFANEFNAALLLGYRFNLDKHSLLPAFRFTYLSLVQRPYAESGSFALKVDSKFQQALLPSVGISYSFNALDNLKLSAGAFLFYDVLSKTIVNNVSFLDEEISFNVASLANAPFGGNVNASIKYDITSSHNLALSYIGTFKQALVATAFSFRYGYRF